MLLGKEIVASNVSAPNDLPTSSTSPSSDSTYALILSNADCPLSKKIPAVASLNPLLPSVRHITGTVISSPGPKRSLILSTVVQPQDVRTSITSSGTSSGFLIWKECSTCVPARTQPASNEYTKGLVSADVVSLHRINNGIKTHVSASFQEIFALLNLNSKERPIPNPNKPRHLRRGYSLCLRLRPRP